MEDRLPRKLAAILYADVAGYSRLTGEDEDTTHRILTEYLDFISTAIESHRGQGDALRGRCRAGQIRCSGRCDVCRCCHSERTQYQKPRVTGRTQSALSVSVSIRVM